MHLAQAGTVTGKNIPTVLYTRPRLSQMARVKYEIINSLMHLAQAVSLSVKKIKTVVHPAQAGTDKKIAVLKTWHRLSQMVQIKKSKCRAPGTGWHR